MANLKETNKKIEEGVVNGYKKIEEGVVGGYKKIEKGVVEGFEKITDKFVDKCLTKEGETVEEAKKRIAEEQKIREDKSREKMDSIKVKQDDIVKKNFEASFNAGKRN